MIIIQRPFQIQTGQGLLPCGQANKIQKSKSSSSVGPQGLGCEGSTRSSHHQTSSKPNWSKWLPTFWAKILEIPSQVSHSDSEGWVSEASSYHLINHLSKSQSQTLPACLFVNIMWK